MNSKYTSDIRFSLGSSGIVKEGYLCRKFGTDTLEDIPDDKFMEVKAFIYELFDRIRKDRRTSRNKNKRLRTEDESNYFKYNYNTDRVARV